MQVEHTTEKGRVLFVKVPDDSYGHYIHKKNLLFDLKSDKGCDIIRLKSLNWQLIAPTTEVTEEMAKMMVDGIYCKKNGCYLFKNYMESDYDFEFEDTAIDSFKSLMQHLRTYEVNPYGGAHSVAYDLNRSLWQEYQLRTGLWITLFEPKEN